MIIRPATIKDAAAIDVFDDFRGNRPTEIERKEVWVAEINEQIVGYITFNYSFYRKPFIKYLMIHPDYRRRGVSEALVSFIENQCEGKKLFMSTEADNFPMIYFMVKHQFRLVGMVNEIQEAAEVVYCKDLQ